VLLLVHTSKKKNPPLSYPLLIGFSTLSQMMPTSKMIAAITAKTVTHRLGFLKWYNSTVTFLLISFSHIGKINGFVKIYM
jgi:hypothetical protein